MDLRILQMSLKLCCPINCKTFEIDFFFSVGLPPKASNEALKNKLKSPASTTFLVESK